MKKTHHDQQKTTSASPARALRSCGAFLQEQCDILTPAAPAGHQDRVVPTGDDQRDPWGRQHHPALSLVALQGWHSSKGPSARWLRHDG